MTGQGNGEPRLSPRRVAARLKAAKAVELRALDWTWQAIADEIGFNSESAAIKAADRLLKSMPSVDDRDEWRKVEGVRLELATAAILNRVLDGDDQAILSFVRLATRRAKLMGLDAPEEIILGGSGEPIRVEVLSTLDAEGLALAKQLRGRVAEQQALRSGDLHEGEAEEESDGRHDGS